MPIEVNQVQARNASLIPQDIFNKFDGIDDRFLAGIENYSGPFTLFVATGDDSIVDDEFGVAIVIRTGVITALVVEDALAEENDDRLWVATFAALVDAMKAAYPSLIVHDTDEGMASLWEEHGFQRIPPPLGETAESVEVLAWNTAAPEVWSTLKRLRLAWARDVHRYPSRRVSKAPLN